MAADHTIGHSNEDLGSLQDIIGEGAAFTSALQRRSPRERIFISERERVAAIAGRSQRIAKGSLDTRHGDGEARFRNFEIAGRESGAEERPQGMARYRKEVLIRHRPSLIRMVFKSHASPIRMASVVSWLMLVGAFLIFGAAVFDFVFRG